MSGFARPVPAAERSEPGTGGDRHQGHSSWETGSSSAELEMSLCAAPRLLLSVLSGAHLVSACNPRHEKTEISPSSRAIPMHVAIFIHQHTKSNSCSWPSWPDQRWPDMKSLTRSAGDPSRRARFVPISQCMSQYHVICSRLTFFVDLNIYTYPRNPTYPTEK